ncbi:MAG: hypothetical protein JWM04_895, partial [Verrucomicrobiales bacterium]|nr:hypothetical protein [Verrucomicrobiales bacterium]
MNLIHELMKRFVPSRHGLKGCVALHLQRVRYEFDNRLHRT